MGLSLSPTNPREMNFTAKSESPMRAKTDNHSLARRAFALSPELKLGGKFRIAEWQSLMKCDIMRETD
jgi:hypothetical protein